MSKDEIFQGPYPLAITYPRRLVVDLSSIIWTCLKVGVDKENRIAVVDEEGNPVLNTKGEQKYINSSTWGYDNSINHFTALMREHRFQPWQMIFVKEGMNAKLHRQALYADYKAKRDKLPQEYVEFQKARDQILELFLSLGAQCVWQDGVEADDVIGYLAKNLKGEVYIDSSDKDLCVLVDRKRVHMIRMGELDPNPFGPFPHHFSTVHIALVGDNADGIPGAKGFGQGAFEKMLIAFGEDGLELMEGLIKDRSLGRLVEDVGALKELQKIIDNQQGVYISYELGRLHVERVNTASNPLQWRAGMVKPAAEIEDRIMRPFGGKQMLVHRDNYDEAVKLFRDNASRTPFFALDIETSTPDESDEWLAAQDKDDGSTVDVLGSELTGLSITFGANLQYTLYLTADHVEEEGVFNLSVEQVRDLVDCVPRDKETWVHNSSFELPVLYMHWGDAWASDNLFHGFLRNVRDTLIASSYVDENRSKGLKSLSTNLLGYTQQTYEDTVTRTYEVSAWNGLGRVVRRWCDEVVVDDPESTTVDLETGVVVVGTKTVDGPEMVTVQHKMNQLRAREVVGYGCDDTICTAALANHFMTVMELESTIDTFHVVETFPAYLTALSYVHGFRFSQAEMAKLEQEDDQDYQKHWAVLRQYLIDKGFDGTVCPVYEELTPAAVKALFLMATDGEVELDTKVRTLSKLAKLISQYAENPEHERHSSVLRILASIVESENLDAANSFASSRFKGEPKLDLDSPKQMRKFLYDVVGLPVQIINDVTAKEKSSNPALAEAVFKHKKLRSGKAVTFAPEQLSLLKLKAKTDDTAVDYALAFDSDSLDAKDKGALKAMAAMKKIATRRKLFYNVYRRISHWKDGNIHSSMNQCAAVTRRYSSTGPNVQQQPKKGSGARFRGCVKPHHPKAVVASIDFKGQELILAAWRSQDQNMMACYIGEKRKDIHSITASGAMKMKWGAQVVHDIYGTHGDGIEPDNQYDLFVRIHGLGKDNELGKKADDLRKDAKNVNFAAQFGGKAAKLSETLIMRLEDAQLFLDARSKMFPDVDKAAERAANFARQHGYATTMLGARRHLREALMSEDRRVSSAAERQAWNMEIQGSAGEMTKLAMARLWLSNVFFRLDCRFIAPIHDELVSSVAFDDAAEFIRIKHECMTRPYADMKIPVMGSISLGPDFYRQYECGDDYDINEINKAVQKCRELSAATAH